MRKRFLPIHILALLMSQVLAPFALSQTPQGQKSITSQPNSQQPKQDSATPEAVVRITTRLIQIDAVVVDKDGKQVTNLKPEDFKIFEDGKEQSISNFSYIALQRETPKAENTPTIIANKTTPPLPPARIKPEQVRRTIALIADDLGLSFESTAYVRQALKKFVDEQMQPGDLVAIIRSSAGNGALQQFTSDKRLLHAAIERLRWYPFGRNRIGAFEPMGGRGSIEHLKAIAANTTPGGGAVSVADKDVLKDSDADGEFRNSREQISSVGTIGAIRYVVDGLRELPGRKSVVLLSDGLPIFPEVGSIMGNRNTVDRSSRDIVNALRNLTEKANRASVVIYTMDMRGLQTLGLNAADDTQATFDMLQASSGSASAAGTNMIVNRKRGLANEYFRTQDGLNYMALQTGGFLIHDNNDFAGGIQKIVDDQRGYYLIGYEPDDATFDELGRRTFHQLKVTVTKPGLRVRSRTGFFGISDEETKRPLETREQQLSAALASPFTKNGVEVMLTSLFGGETEKPMVRSLIHINSRDLTFTQQANGDYTTVVDIAATTHDENGLTIDRGARSYSLRVKATEYETALRDGIMYALDVPIKKPGAYQLRLAVRDENSQRLGSATQFIEVPDLKKDRLSLSGISMNGSYDKGGKPEAVVQASPVLRRMRRGMVLNYGYAVYNARLATGQRPQLTTQVKLFCDGKEVFTGKEAALAEPQPPNTKRILAGGAIDLGANLKPGEYILQVVVNDLLAKEKQRTVTQWMNFEIVN
ncbi:MAG: VWA domain-containing protein [Blastocatellia bacterium]|nr:VWA domain-containing protein [Blastocatellia bacterium]